MTWRDQLPVLDERRLYREAVNEGFKRRRRAVTRRRTVLAAVGLVALGAVGVSAIANYDPDAGNDRQEAAADTTAAGADTTAAVAAGTTAGADTTAAGGDTTAAAETTAATTTAAAADTTAGAETTAAGVLGLSHTPSEVWETPPAGEASCGPETVVVRYRHPTAITQATLTFTIDGSGVVRPMDVAGSEATLEIGPFADATTAGEGLLIGLTVEGVDVNGIPFSGDDSVPLRGCPPTG